MIIKKEEGGTIVMLCHAAHILRSDFIMLAPLLVRCLFPQGANATSNPFGHLLPNPPSRFLFHIVWPMDFVVPLGQDPKTSTSHMDRNPFFLVTYCMLRANRHHLR
jgi:hypothetical protein